MNMIGDSKKETIECNEKKQTKEKKRSVRS